MDFEKTVGEASEQLEVPKEKEVQKTESWEQTKSRLKSQFWIGMPYDDIIAILGKPTNINDGSEMLAGGTTIASRKSIAMISQMQFLNWNKPEARYFLTITSGKLASIDYINPPVSENIEKTKVKDNSKKPVQEKSVDAKEGIFDKIKNIFKKN